MNSIDLNLNIKNIYRRAHRKILSKPSKSEMGTLRELTGSKEQISELTTTRQKLLGYLTTSIIAYSDKLPDYKEFDASDRRWKPEQVVFIDNDAKSLVSCAVDEDKDIIDEYSNAKGCAEPYKDPEAGNVVEEHSTNR